MSSVDAVLDALLAEFERSYDGLIDLDHSYDGVVLGPPHRDAEGIAVEDAYDVLASRPDLFTCLPATGRQHQWVRTGSERDPRRLVHALGEAPGGLSVSSLAAALGRPKKEVLAALEALGRRVRAVGIGPPLWSLTQPVEDVLVSLDRAPRNPYPIPRYSAPPPPTPLSPSEIRQRMVDQVPGYRARLAALEAFAFQRPDNQAALRKARKALARVESRFTPEGFRDLGSLVRALERARDRELQPAPVVKPPPTPHVDPATRPGNRSAQRRACHHTGRCACPSRR